MAKRYPNEAIIVENGTKMELNECFNTYELDKSFCEQKTSNLTIILMVSAAILLILLLLIGGIYIHFKTGSIMNFPKRMKNVSINQNAFDLKFKSILPINKIPYNGPKDNKLKSLYYELEIMEQQRLSMSHSMDKFLTKDGMTNEIFIVNGKIDALEQRIIFKTLMLKYPEEFQIFKNTKTDDLQQKYYEIKNNYNNYRTYLRSNVGKEKIYNKSELDELATLARETFIRKTFKPVEVDDVDYDDLNPTINLQLSEIKLETYKNKLNSADRWYHKFTDKFSSIDQFEKKEYLRSLLRQRVRYAEELLNETTKLKGQHDKHQFLGQQIEVLKNDIDRRDEEWAKPLFPNETPRNKLDPDEVAKLKRIQLEERKWRAEERSQLKNSEQIQKSLDDEALSDQLNELLIDGLKYRQYRHPSLYPDNRWLSG